MTGASDFKDSLNDVAFITRNRTLVPLLEGLIDVAFITSIERNPPPREGFLSTMFSNQEPGGNGPPIQILRGGTSSSGFLMRGHSK